MLTSIYYETKRGIPVTYVAYAHDILFFTNDTEVRLRRLMKFLKLDIDISSQALNDRKSTFIIKQGCSVDKIQKVQDLTNFKPQFLPLTYLGAPLYKGNTRGALFQIMLTRTQNKVMR